MTTILLLAAFLTATAQERTAISDVRLSRNGDHVQLTMNVNIARERPSQSSVVVYTPRLVGATDSIDFPEVAIFGRHTYYYNVRAGKSSLVGDSAFLIRHKGGPRSEHYARTVGYQPWMAGSVLKLIRTDGDPCNRSEAVVEALMEGFTQLPPDTSWVVTKKTRDEELTGRVSGQARITFRVNRTEILPDQYGNSRELQKMMDAINEVRSNKDVRITKYTLKGYASPEGPYDNNVRLARGRTEALKQFMTARWGVPASQITTSFEPEDWEGFRRYVEEHRGELKNADGLLRLISLDTDPDTKLAGIAAQYPEDYKAILENCFPALRRTDYTIEYDWLRIEQRDDGEDRQMVLTPRPMKTDGPMEDDVLTQLTPTRPWLALKTNLLFDVALAMNVELEAQLGRDSRWSIMVEDWFPWYLYRRDHKGDTNKYRRTDWKAYKSAYEIWAMGAELRYWLRPRCPEVRPWLTGTFLGAYVASGKYDWEWRESGDQGEFISFGASFGHSWELARHWNLELSASLGYVHGPRRHYEGRFDNSRLIWQHNDNLRYFGPTKLKLSIAWLIPALKKHRQKGGAQ